MSTGVGDPKSEQQEPTLAAARGVIERLGAEIAELKMVIAELQKALDASEGDVARFRALYEQQRPNQPERVASVEQQLVLDGMLGAFSTQLAAANDVPAPADVQASADVQAPADVPAPASDDPIRKKPSRSGHGRRPLELSGLPVDTVFIDPPEVVAAGGVGFTLIGGEPSDRIAYSPARFIRLRLVRRTYRKDTAPDVADDTALSAEEAPPPDAVLLTAPIPDAVWPRVMADPSAIANAIVNKYDDLLPLHRQERITHREGFKVPRSTLCEWLRPAETFLTGIVDAMFVDGKATAHYLAGDATGASVRGHEKTACESWHVFVFVAAKQHVVFRYSRTHDSRVLAKMLAGYHGYLLADASSIYAPLVTAGMIVLACCWAHVRRYFFKARETDPTRSVEAIAIIGKLFEVERMCAGTPMPEKTARRAELATPILQLFDEWLARHLPSIVPRTPLAAAFTYAANQREELRRFLDDGALRIDNNICEGLLRNLVLGLNNWQYFENETGLRWYTVFRSLIASCKMHDLCPQRYLECVLRLAPHWPQTRLLELSPMHWKATAARLTPSQLATVSPSWSSAFDAFAPRWSPAATMSARSDAAA